MEPNKIEIEIREKLNSRAIQPSNQAWERLDTMLLTAETKSKKRSFNWLAFAASIVVFFGVGSLFLNKNRKEIKTTNSIVIENRVRKTSSEKATNQVQKEVITPEKGFNPTSKILVTTKNKDEIINPNVKIEEVRAIVIQSNDKIDPMENQKKSIQIDSDDLLASVEKEIGPKTNKAAVKVNSMALLNEVDGELELTFREKALNAIAKKYKATREAFVNRNNQ